jgi:hypothetical protein
MSVVPFPVPRASDDEALLLWNAVLVAWAAWAAAPMNFQAMRELVHAYDRFEARFR